MQTPRSRLRPRVAPWLFLTPAIVLAAGLMFAPLVYTVILSLQGRKVPASGIGVATEVFVGLDNYIAALTNPALLGSFLRMLAYALLSVPLTM